MTSPDPSVSWADIKEGVGPCVFGDHTLTDPKQLKCLHPVCRVCLNAKIEGREGDTVCCPKCSRQIKIPKNGIDGFQTDSLAESVCKLNEIHLTFSQRQKQERCCICERKGIQSYCFQCGGYLCGRCNKRHNQNVPAFHGHLSALLALRDFSSKDGNVQKIFGHIAPKCKNHPTKTASKCCDNCNNDVLCDQCINESHIYSRHVIQQISDTVKHLDEDINNLLPPIEKGIANIQNKLENIDDTKEEIDNKIKRTSDNLETSYNHELLKIKTVENFVEGKYEEKESNRKNDLAAELGNLEKSMEEEMKELAEKYRKLKIEKEEKSEITKRKLETSLKKEKQKIEEIRQTMTTNYRTLENDLNVTGTAKRTKVSEMIDHFNQTILRHGNLNAALSRVRATGSDWIFMKEIPVIRAAAEDLTQDINKSFPTLSTLVEFPPFKLEEMNFKYNESVWEEDEDPITTEEDKTAAGTKNGRETTEL